MLFQMRIWQSSFFDKSFYPVILTKQIVFVLSNSLYPFGLSQKEQSKMILIDAFFAIGYIALNEIEARW